MLWLSGQSCCFKNHRSVVQIKAAANLKAHKSPSTHILFAKKSGDVEGKVKGRILGNQASVGYSVEVFNPSKEGNFDKVSRHKALGKFYRDATDPKVWYSKEVSGDRAHGGEHWKKFIQKGRELHLEELVDISGKVMNRLPGKKAKVIDMKNLIGIQ